MTIDNDGRNAREALSQPIEDWPYAQEKLLTYLDPALIEKHGYAQLGRALNLGRVICVVGSGTSAGFGMPPWVAFLEVAGGVIASKLKLSEETRPSGKSIDDFENARRRQQYILLIESLRLLGVEISAGEPVVVADPENLNFPVVLELLEKLYIEVATFLNRKLLPGKAREEFRGIIKRLLGDLMGGAENLMRRTLQRIGNAAPEKTFLISLVLHILENKPLGSRRNVAPISAVEGLPSLLALTILQYDNWRSVAPGSLKILPGINLDDLEARLIEAIRISPSQSAEETADEQKRVFNRICNQPALAFLRDHLVARLATTGADVVHHSLLGILVKTVTDSKSLAIDRELREWVHKFCSLQVAKLDELQTHKTVQADKDVYVRQRNEIREIVVELERRLADHLDVLGAETDRYDRNRQRPILIPRHRDTLSALYDTLRINRFITTNYDTELERLLATRGYRVTDVDSARLQSGAGPIMSVRTINWLGSRGQDFVLGRRNAADLIDFATQGRADAVQIFHLHGRATDDADIVLTERDYLDLYLGEDRVREITDDALRLVFSANPLLFVGVGMTEEDVMRPLRAFMTRDLTLTDRPAVALLPATRSAKECGAKAMTLMSRFGVYTIHYGRGRFAPNLSAPGDPCEEEHVLRKIVDRCSGLKKMAKTLSETRSGDRTQALYKAVLENQTPIRNVDEIHGSPSDAFPIDVEIKLLNVIGGALSSMAAGKTQIDSNTLTDLERLLNSMTSAFQTPFCCAALHEMRHKWLQWRSDWGKLPQPRDPKTPAPVEGKPIELERHAVRLRDLGIEAATHDRAWPTPEPTEPSTVGPDAVTPDMRGSSLSQPVTAPDKDNSSQTTTADTDELEKRIRRLSCAPLTDRFFSSPPSPSFESLREALEQRLPKRSREARLHSRTFLFLADRGMGKGQFFAALQEPGRFAELCRWLQIADANADQDSVKNNVDADGVHRAFFNLGLSNEFLSVFDQLAGFYEDTCLTLGSKASAKDTASLKQNRIARLRHALARLSDLPDTLTGRIVVAINHVNTFFEPSGRPKNAQVAMLWNTLFDPAYDGAPIDYILLTNDRTMPGLFRKHFEFKADTLVTLDEKRVKSIAFRHLISEYADAAERRRTSERLRTAGLRTIHEDAVSIAGRRHYVHVLRRPRPETFAARFFPLAAEGLARLACQGWESGDSRQQSSVKYTRGEAYGRYKCITLDAEGAEAELQRAQKFQLAARDAFDGISRTASSGANISGKLDKALSRAVALHALAHRLGPGQLSSNLLMTHVVDSLEADEEDDSLLRQLLNSNGLSKLDHDGLFAAVKRKFDELSDISGESRFAMTLVLAAVSDVYESAIRSAFGAFKPANSVRVNEPLAATMANADAEVESFLSALRLATVGRRPESREDVVMSVVLDFYDRHQADHPVWPFAPSWERTNRIKFTGEGIDCTRLTSLDLYQIEEATEFVAGSFAVLSEPNSPDKAYWPVSKTQILKWDDKNENITRLRRYLVLDAAVGYALDSAPGGLVSAVTETILVALSLIGQPVSPDVLLACPDVRAATVRLCRAVEILPVTGLVEKAEGVANKDGSLGPVTETEAVRLALIGILDLMVHRCLIFRLGGEDRTLPAGSLSRQRFAVHKSVRRHVHNVIDAPMVDQAEVDLLAFSLFASQPNELPRPNPAAHGRLMRMIDALIGYEAPDIGEPFPEIITDSNGKAQFKLPNGHRLLERVRRQRRRKLQQLRAAYGVLRSIYSVGVVSGLHVAGATLGAPPPGGLLEQYRLKVRWTLKRCVHELERARLEEAEADKIDDIPHVKPSLSSPFYGDEIAWLYNECGVISLVQGKLGDAAALFERATSAVQTWVESSRSGPLHNRLQLNAALCDIERGATRQARRHLRQIQDSEFENEIMKAIARGYTGLIDHLAGNFDPALKAYKESIDFLIGVRRNRAASLLSRHLVDLLIARGDKESLESAQVHIKNAMNLAADGGHEDVRHGVLITRTRLAMYRGVSSAADMFAQLRSVDSYAKAAGIPRLLCEAALMRGQIQIRNGDFHGAGLEARAALEVATRSDLQLRKISAMILQAQVLKGTDQQHEAQPLLIRAMALADRAQFYLARDAAERLTASTQS